MGPMGMGWGQGSTSCPALPQQPQRAAGAALMEGTATTMASAAATPSLAEFTWDGVRAPPRSSRARNTTSTSHLLALDDLHRDLLGGATPVGLGGWSAVARRARDDIPSHRVAGQACWGAAGQSRERQGGGGAA